MLQLGPDSSITPDYVEKFLSFPGNGVLVAIEEGPILGLLSYSLRPSLYHAGNACLIEDFVVRKGARGRGVGDALLSHLFDRLAMKHCVEVSVATMSENTGAIRFYKAHGLTDEALLLERHF